MVCFFKHDFQVVVVVFKLNAAVTTAFGPQNVVPTANGFQEHVAKHQFYIAWRNFKNEGMQQ